MTATRTPPEGPPESPSEGPVEPGTVQKRSVLIAGHPTSVSLEAAFWDALKAVAAGRGCSVNALVESVDRARTGNLSSALRVFVLRHSQGGER